MANPSIDALKRQTEEQSRVYKQLQAETNSLIAAQRGVVKALGLQKNSILGSVANVGFTIRESMKVAQLKLQERKLLETQLVEQKRRILNSNWSFSVSLNHSCTVLLDER